ncbi:MAG: Hsp20/alpha crystallin family protein [Tannerella sp.]|jgi:HSP20 family protein|nr:Hsp20/alpha crystallin family protein [Tannerella sp.]
MLPLRRTNWLPSVFNDFFGNEWIEKSNSANPAVNILESDKAYIVEVAAPGLTKDDFHIDLHDDNHLEVSMEKRAEKKEGDEKKFLRREFSYMNFRQSLLLPDNVDCEKIDAAVKDGILTINIPKRKEEEKESAPKQINIH